MAVPSQTPLEEAWLLTRERAVAWLRLAFALVAIAVIQLNPSRIVRFPEFSYYFLGSFLAYSIAILVYFTLKNKFASTLSALTTALDMFWIAMIVVTTGGSRTPFFFYYSFPVITASMRWGLKGSLPVALVGVAIYATIRLSLAAESEGQPIGIDTIVVRSLYLVLLACIFGYVSEFEKKQNQRLLALSQTAAQVAALQERRRIEFELHDGTLQSLATLILRLENCRRKLPESEKTLDKELRSMEDLTRDSMNEIRLFLSGKESKPLTPGSLLARLKEELRFLQECLGLTVLLETEPDDVDLPENIEKEIYYVLREGLSNVTRHAHATRIILRLSQDGTALKGSLNDDGVGIRPSSGRKGSGFGLTSMKERIEKLGGELTLESTPGAGTKISFSVPLTSSL